MMNLTKPIENRFVKAWDEMVKERNSLTFFVLNLAIGTVFIVFALASGIYLFIILGVLATGVTYIPKLVRVKCRVVTDGLQEFIDEGWELWSKTQIAGSPPITKGKVQDWVDGDSVFVERHGDEKCALNFRSCVAKGEPTGERHIGGVYLDQSALINQVEAGCEWLEALINEKGKLPASQ